MLVLLNTIVEKLVLELPKFVKVKLVRFSKMNLLDFL